MKLILQREILLKPLQLLAGIVERKQTLPILSNVLIKVENGQLFITGADLEVELIAKIQINSTEQDCFTVSAGKLMDICRALPNDAELNLEHRDSKVVILSGHSRFTLATLPPEDFPIVEEQQSATKCKINKDNLLKLLKLTHFAMAQQDVRYYLNGMLWEFDKRQFRTVATDGHRMAIANTTTEEVFKDRLQIIVPRKGVIELLRLLDEAEEAEIEISHNFIRVITPQYIFTSKLIDGRFPEYRRVIPKNGDKSLIFNREILKQALVRTAILCNEKLRAVCFQFRKEALILRANNVEQEVAEEKLVLQYDQEDFDVVFNVNYLLDVLNVCKTEQVKFVLKDSSSSTLIEEVDGKANATFIVMPMCL